jgi:hypothetical protein
MRHSSHCDVPRGQKKISLWHAGDHDRDTASKKETAVVVTGPFCVETIREASNNRVD